MGCSPRAERRTLGAATDPAESPAAAAAVLRTLRLVGSACGLLHLLSIALSLFSAFSNAKASIVSPTVPSKRTARRAPMLVLADHRLAVRCSRPPRKTIPIRRSDLRACERYGL